MSYHDPAHDKLMETIRSATMNICETDVAQKVQQVVLVTMAKLSSASAPGGANRASPCASWSTQAWTWSRPAGLIETISERRVPNIF